MQDNCKDCSQINNLQEQIKTIWHNIKEIKEVNKDFEVRITQQERVSDVAKTKMDTIFDMVSEIKETLKGINTKLENLEQKPARRYENLSYEVIKYIIIACVAVVIGKIM